MCGRFGLTEPLQLQRAHGLFERVGPDVVSDEATDLFLPRYNIAPSQPVIAARTVRRERRTAAERLERRIDVLRWGLIPSWAKDPTIGNRLANARAETVIEKPSFRGAWKAARRCLVFASVFYEWQDVGDTMADPRNGDPGTTGRRLVARRPKPAKQPHAIRMADDSAFAFGGLWEAWRDPQAPDTLLPTCTLITTAPNRLMARIHDRMPVIIPAAQFDVWLDPQTSHDVAQALLVPYAPTRMRSYPITPYVNSPAHDDPHVLDPFVP